MWLAFLCAVAWADDPRPSADDGSGTSTSPDPGDATPLPDDQPATPPPPPPVGDAEPLGELSKRQIRFLKPRHGELSQVPRDQVDFTAYSLEFGEVRLGLAALTAGVLPRVQVGTVPILDGLDVWNVNAKWNAVRLGPLDLAAQAAYYVLPLGGFVGTYKSAGGAVSLRLAKPWSIHLGVDEAQVGARGVPDLTHLSPLLSQFTDDQLDAWTFDGTFEPKAALMATTVHVATDVRFNRRDSLIAQLSFTPYATALYDLGAEPPPILGIDQQMDYGGDFPFAKTYVASLSYQMTFKHVDVRMGGGWSALPLAWLLPAEDVSYRLGGETRHTETRQKHFWRKSRHDNGDVPVVDPGTPGRRCRAPRTRRARRRTASVP